MKKLVINLTRTTQQVDVRHSDGKLDSVQIMARSRATLRDGMDVDPRWMQKHPNTVTVKEV